MTLKFKHMIMKYLFRFTLLFLISGIFTACEKEDPPEEENLDDTLIKEEIKDDNISSSTGGTIELESGVLLDIPSSALSSDVSITIEVIDPYLKENKFEVPKEIKGIIISALVRCSPEGTTFNSPVQLTIPYYPELFPENLPVDSMVVVSCSGGHIESHSFTLDQNNQMVVVETDHFSDFVILADRNILVDRGRIYNTIVLGDQVWMAENLAYLPALFESNDMSTDNPRYYVFGFEGSSLEEAKSTMNYFNYGVLYNWPAAMESCPEGWHLPDDDDWKQLELFIGMDPDHIDLGHVARERGPGVGTKLKAKSGWAELYERAKNGTDDFGFRVLPSGNNVSYSNFIENGAIYTWFWTATINEEYKVPWVRRISYLQLSNVFRNAMSPELGISVRCVKD